MVCSRKEEYGNYETQIRLNGAICLKELNDTQIEYYLIRLQQENLWQTLQRDESLLAVVRAPLMLSITVLSAQSLSIGEWQKLPSLKAQVEYLLDAYIQKMLSREMIRSLYKKHKYISNKQVRYYLYFLAEKLQRESKTEFMIEEIQPVWLVNQKLKLDNSGKSYKTFESKEWLYRSVLRLIFFLFGLTINIPVGIILAIRWSEDDIYPLESLNWSWDSIKTKMKHSYYFVLAGGFSGLLMGGLLLGLACSAIGGLVFMLIAGLSDDLRTWRTIELETRKTPNQAILKSAKNAVIIGLFAGVCAGLIFGLMWALSYEPNNSEEELMCLELATNGLNCRVFNGVAGGISVGLHVGLISGIFCGGKACVQHFFLRSILYLNRSIPWNYARFLDHCTERNLLQRVGGRYRFIHRLLQEHFAVTSLDKVTGDR